MNRFNTEEEAMEWMVNILSEAKEILNYRFAYKTDYDKLEEYHKVSTMDSELIAFDRDIYIGSRCAVIGCHYN